MYQNLVRSWDTQAPDSVHFCDYPQAKPALVDEQLMAEMRLVMRTAAIGHAARNQAAVKVRQPLPLAVVKPRSPAEAEGLERLAEQIRDELNVKEIRVVADESDVVDYHVSAIPSQVGKKYKDLFPAIKAMLSSLDPAEVAAKVRDGQPVHLAVQGQEVTLEAADIQVQTAARAGFALAEDGGYCVAVCTEISEELRQEGLAREIVRRIQTMRKDAGFRIEDTIETYYQASPTLAPVLESWADYIQQETLSTRLLNASPPADAYVEAHELDSESLTLAVRRNQ
jgi:isoleucyl-tRNA synthetase